MTRYALGVEYDGGGFLGWQRLSKSGTPDDTSTVQAALEGALSSVADARVDTICAGRTDAGVHAQCQVVHFDSDAARTPRGWLLGATARLAHERPEGMEEAAVMMVGLEEVRIMQALQILEAEFSSSAGSVRPVADYSMPNVSEKVVRLIHSYADYVGRVVWKRY